LPVDFSQAQLDAAEYALKTLQDIGPYVTKLARVLEFSSSSEIPKPFAAMIRTVIIAASRASSDLPAFVRFAGRLPSVQKQADFSGLVSEIWTENPPLKAAQIIWNCFVMHENRSGLSSFDLNMVHVGLPDWYLLKLPESFTDFFSEELGGDEILELAPKKVVMRCLRCGKALTFEPGPRGCFEHARDCSVLSIMILGQIAPSVILCVPSQQPMGRRALYVDSQGDDDVGLRAGNPLVLSHERRNDIVRSILSGKWTPFRESDRDYH
jgi:hypothetical protein